MNYPYRYILPQRPSFRQNRPVTCTLLLAIAVLVFTGCKKLIEIAEPIDTITTTKVFSTDAQANAAMAGVLTQLINGNKSSSSVQNGFASGLSTVLGSLSSDDLTYYTQAASSSYYIYNTNRLTNQDQPSTILWTSGYNAVYGANAILEGIAASSSPKLRDSMRNLLTGEARFIRAFSYFYLTNFFGELPLVLNTDYSSNAQLLKSPQTDIYHQIVEDLKDARQRLPADYSPAAGERIRPNKWAATALLSRVYLYTEDYANAVAEATKVIDQQVLYDTVPLDNVFLRNSKEAIWQLQQNTSIRFAGTGTPEGMLLLPDPIADGIVPMRISEYLNNAFETDDQRKTHWTGATNAGFPYPYKYKTGWHNYVMNATPDEYYMVLRLAEQYLIRAEALARGGPAGTEAAIKDLNVIRARAGLDALPLTLSQEATIAAVMKERQTELFAEWAHRWFDLRRTGKAHDVLSVMPLKQPWPGDYQFLYPIPAAELRTNTRLIQNNGYN